MEINDEEVEPITIEPLSEANDFGFEPQARLRANTWPVRPRECATPEEASSSTPPVPETSENVLDEYDESPLKDSGSGLVKKAGTRRNAWGSLSYADLITKAIESTADKRLTLSQIYDWMVQNVPYFKDKGDNNSSAGWKVSLLPIFYEMQLCVHTKHFFASFFCLCVRIQFVTTCRYTTGLCECKMRVLGRVRGG